MLDKNDETCTISNSEFLETIFGHDRADVATDICPVLVSFKGNPQKIKKGAWFGRVWNPDDPAPSPDHNNYFSLAVFRPNEAGEYRRQKKQFVALHAIMLDDVGDKVALDRLTLPPSWLLETSPGNYQAGYIMAEPLQDFTTVDRLMNAVINAGLCDPGASGPTARLARLPEAVNGKHDPAFPCAMKGWKPELRYTVQDLIDGLQLDMRPAGRHKSEKGNPDGTAKKKSKNEQYAAQSDGSDPIFTPRPEENAVITALRTRSLYKEPLGEGKHDVTCPWVTEHTNAVNGGTAYFEPDDSFPVGGFKCLHGHCAKRHVRDLLQFLNIEVNAARMKSVIRIVPGEIHRIVDKAEAELSTGHKYYQRGGLIVTVGTDPGTKKTSVRTISLPALVAGLAGAATWERFDGRSQEWVRTDPPERHCSVLFNATAYRHLSILNGLARQPYLRPDGTLATVAGYDSPTGMFAVFDAKKFSVPDQPGKADAEAALLLIKELLEEFLFQNESDKSAALAAILTAAIRPSLPVAPMFHVRAPQISSGKSFLCKLITAFASPQRAAPTTFPQDDEECRKVLLAELMRSPAVIEFDNLTSDLIPHKSLCATLTEEYMTGRILGVSKTATVSTRALFLSSGNNVSPVQDMTRRCLTVNLDPACEVPAARTFKKPELLAELHRERPRYVSAALTIIRAWIVAGRPKTECKALAGYGDWSDLCRQPLLWLGQADPTESVFEAMTDDPDRETLGRLLYSWEKCFGSKPTMVREAVNRTMEYGLQSSYISELKEALNDIALDRDGINRRVLGRWIKRHANRIVDGRRFVRASGSRSAEAWRVESVS